MALFKSAEDKAAEQARKEKELLEKYGIGNLTNPDDLASMKKIATELAGSGLAELGMKISMKSPEVMLPISYQRTIMEQNFIIIRQLDRIAKLLDK